MHPVPNKWRPHPTGMGYWWHTFENSDGHPHIYSVQRSGTNGRYFVDFPDSRWCDEIGGLWCKVTEMPQPPAQSQGEERVMHEKCRYTGKPISECKCPDGCETNTMQPGEWTQPVTKGYRMECCDCGLVHLVDFRLQEGRIQLRAYRESAAPTTSTGER